MIQIFILTHNRPDLLIRSIDSVLNQRITTCSYEIIVSDNSTNDETQIIISKLYSNKSLIYLRRSPMSSIEHFNTILSEVTADFFVLFHDDDIMYPNMVETLVKAMKNDDKLLAVGSNAKLVKNDKITNNFFKASTDIEISTVDQLVVNYLSPCHAPFPSYMYRKFVAKNIQLDLKKGGKYCDVSFLTDIASQGAIKMLKEPLMSYYLHDGQDSASLDCEQQDSLIRYIVNVSSFTKKSSLIMQYRISNFYAKLSRLGKPVSTHRWLKVKDIFFKYSPFFLFPRIVVKRILKLV
jgi:glycosyltransferase involved in cell wall biosynthesis